MVDNTLSKKKKIKTFILKLPVCILKKNNTNMVAKNIKKE